MPAPFGPEHDQRSRPAPSSRSTPSRAVRSPKSRRRPRSSIAVLTRGDSSPSSDRSSGQRRFLRSVRRPTASSGPAPSRSAAVRVRALAVEQLRRGADRLAEGAVVGVPPEVAGQPRLPGVHLDVDALVEAEFGVRAADAGVLDAAPGALAGAVAEGVVVDPDHPRLDPPRDPLALLAVLGPDRGAEAELGVVGEVDRLLLGVDDDDRQHRAEDLLAHDPHLVGDAGEDGRGDELAGQAGDLGRAAAELGRAGGDRVLDQLDDDLVLVVGGHRADLGLPLRAGRRAAAARPRGRRPRRSGRRSRAST